MGVNLFLFSGDRWALPLVVFLGLHAVDVPTFLLTPACRTNRGGPAAPVCVLHEFMRSSRQRRFFSLRRNILHAGPVRGKWSTGGSGGGKFLIPRAVQVSVCLLVGRADGRLSPSRSPSFRSGWCIHYWDVM